MTEFSPEVRCILEAAGRLLTAARRFRKDRQLGLPPEDVRPVRPEGWVWGDDKDKEGVVALWASDGFVLPKEVVEKMEWDDAECPPQLERRIHEPLASGAHGTLNYKIWPSSSGDGQRQRPSRPRRPRPPRVLPGAGLSLLLTVFREAPAGPLAPSAEQRDVTQRMRELTQRITCLKRQEVHAMLETGEDAEVYRTERCDLWQDLQTLKASLHTPPRGLQAPGVCKHVTITVGLGEMSQQEQRRWRKKLGDEPCTTWRTAFRTYLYRHLQTGRNPVYIDVHTTTEDDLTVQVLAYLLQAEMVSWDAIGPWVQHYAASWGQETEGKRWGKDMGTKWYEAMMAFALPQEANALRPRDTAQPLGTMSPPAVARAWGLSEPQLRKLLPWLIRQQKVDGIIKKRRFSFIPMAEVERMKDDEDIKAARVRHTAKQLRWSRKAKDQEPLEDTLSIEEQIFTLEARLDEEVRESDAWCDTWDALQRLKTLKQGSAL